jgi:hypothetical protein
MADDNYETQDDGEYHFSDDQANYEVEPHASGSAPVSAPSGPKVNPLEKLAPFKKPIIIVIVLSILFFGYKLLQAPAQTKAAELPAIAAYAPPHALPEQQAPAPKEIAPVEGVPPAVVKVNLPSQETSINTGNPIASEAPIQRPAPSNKNPMPAPAVTIVQAAAPTTTHADPYTPTVPAPMQQPSGMLMDGVNQKVMALETETVKAKTEVTQKMADYEAQNAALQNKIGELNTRLAGMETTLNRVSEMLNATEKEEAKPETGESTPNVLNITPPPFVAKPLAEPKANYSVQAIIPGRAWLKSEAGETVTVAEGDNIKDFGRVIKIDPYDGIVQVDMGSQIISLSYGASAN